MSAPGSQRPPAPYRRRLSEASDPSSLTRRPAASGDGPVDLPVSLVAEGVRAAVARSTPSESMQAVLDMAVQTGPCDAASITLLGAGKRIETIAASDVRVRTADELQYATGEGPCLDAVWTDGVFVVPDLLADGRWPDWAPRAAELGIGSSMSVHLFTNAALGSLNLYSLAPREFTDTDVENARVIAAQASVVVAYGRAQENLWRAIDARNLIGQAQGMLMQRYGLTGEKAFAVLRRYSQHHNIKLTVLAEQLTTTGQLPDLDADAQTDSVPIPNN